MKYILTDGLTNEIKIYKNQTIERMELLKDIINYIDEYKNFSVTMTYDTEKSYVNKMEQ